MGLFRHKKQILTQASATADDITGGAYLVRDSQADDVRSSSQGWAAVLQGTMAGSSSPMNFTTPKATIRSATREPTIGTTGDFFCCWRPRRGRSSPSSSSPPPRRLEPAPARRAELREPAPAPVRGVRGLALRRTRHRARRARRRTGRT